MAKKKKRKHRPQLAMFARNKRQFSHKGPIVIVFTPKHHDAK